MRLAQTLLKDICYLVSIKDTIWFLYWSVEGPDSFIILIGANARLRDESVFRVSRQQPTKKKKKRQIHNIMHNIDTVNVYDFCATLVATV